jgi:hypothetical protein
VSDSISAAETHGVGAIVDPPVVAELGGAGIGVGEPGAGAAALDRSRPT